MIFLIFLLKKGGSNECPQCMFWMKTRYTPANLKEGFKRVYISRTCFPDDCNVTDVDCNCYRIAGMMNKTEGFVLEKFIVASRSCFVNYTVHTSTRKLQLKQIEFQSLPYNKNLLKAQI